MMTRGKANLQSTIVDNTHPDIRLKCSLKVEPPSSKNDLSYN